MQNIEPTPRVVIGISLSEDVLAVLRRHAEETQTSLTSHIEYLLTRHVNKCRTRDAAPLPDTAPKWEKTLDPVTRLFLDAAEQKGLLAAFTAALRARTGNAQNNPSDVRRFFLTYIRTITPLRVSAPIINSIREQLPNAYLTFYAAQGITMVLTDGAIRCFIPNNLMGVSRAQRSMGPASVIDALLESPDELVRNWVKTRHGMVPAECEMFLAEIAQRNPGDFAVSERI